MFHHELPNRADTADTTERLATTMWGWIHLGPSLILTISAACYAQHLLTQCEARGGPCGSSFYLPQITSQMAVGDAADTQDDEEAPPPRLPLDTAKRERREKRNETTHTEPSSLRSRLVPPAPRHGNTSAKMMSP